MTPDASQSSRNRPLKSWSGRLSRYWILSICMLATFSLDQLTKFWVIGSIPYGTYINPEPIPVLEGFLYWVHIGNTGAAWGIFQGFGLFLALFAIVTILAIFLFRRMLFLHLKSMQLAFGLLIGGILGNLFDRLLHGHVVDFIDVHLPFYRWPAFNVADSAICVGVVSYILISFVQERKMRQSQQAGSDIQNPGT